MRTLDLLGGGEILSEADCWEVLAGEEVGRLAVVAEGKADILPVNFVVDGRSIVICANIGHKLLAASGTHVAFEVDRFDTATKIACSVVVRGPATVEPLEGDGFAWTGPKQFEIRIDPLTVTGRRIAPNPGDRKPPTAGFRP